MYGLLDLSLGGHIVAVLLLTQLSVASVTLYLHRCEAHRAISMHPALKHVFRFWVWLTTAMSAREWASVHRKHHARCETDEDPHSPQVLGLRTVMLEGSELYRKAADDRDTTSRWGHGLPDDWLENHLYARHRNAGVVLMLGLDVLLFGVPGLTIWAVQMLWFPVFAAGLINGVGHFAGYRNFEPRDASRNIVPWALWVGGEELHNNHHAYPTSAKFSIKWWEVDLGWGYIRLLQLLGWVTVRKLPPRLTEREDETIDEQTLQAVLSGRLELMSLFYRCVIKPAWKLEREQLRRQLGRGANRLKQLLRRDMESLPLKDRERLGQLLTRSDRLARVMQFREGLRHVWTASHARQEELVSALRRWCDEAEASGLDRLAQFAARIRRLQLSVTT
jgi:stearoyl-CoA desaturase (delta-9 desaturase)